MPYRSLEESIVQIGTYITGLVSADYATLHRRISKLALNIPISDEDVVAVVDSTGMNVTNRGEWMHEKHGTMSRGWLKVHVAVDVESNKMGYNGCYQMHRLGRQWAVEVYFSTIK